MAQDKVLEKALEDLSTIRGAIERVRFERSNGEAAYQHSLQASTLVQVGGLIGAGIFLIIELFSSNFNTVLMLASAEDRDIQIMGLTHTATLLFLLVFALYIVTFRASQSARSDVPTFLVRYFRHLSSVALLSDLVLKYFFFAALIVTGHPEWVAPLFTLFIADYLFQGRYFTLSSHLSLLLGALCIVAAVVQYSMSSSLLLIPLIVFTVVSVISLFHLRSLKKNSNDGE